MQIFVVRHKHLHEAPEEDSSIRRMEIYFMALWSFSSKELEALLLFVELFMGRTRRGGWASPIKVLNLCSPPPPSPNYKASSSRQGHKSWGFRCSHSIYHTFLCSDVLMDVSEERAELCASCKILFNLSRTLMLLEDNFIPSHHDAFSAFYLLTPFQRSEKHHNLSLSRPSPL